MNEIITVAQLMSSTIATLRPRDSVLEADVAMRLGQIHHLPVVDDQGKLLGILSHRDVLRTLRPGLHRPVPIEEAMTQEVITVRSDAPAHQAARLLRENRVGALPVLDASGKLVGVISEGDLVGVAERALRGEPLSPAPR